MTAGVLNSTVTDSLCWFVAVIVGAGSPDVSIRVRQSQFIYRLRLSVMPPIHLLLTPAQSPNYITLHYIDNGVVWNLMRTLTRQCDINSDDTGISACILSDRAKINN